MAKEIIDIGTSPNKGDGDPLRIAFDKINNNFTELYNRDLNTDSQTLTLTGDILSISEGNSIDLSKYDNSNFSGDYNDLTNKPSIPASLSELSNDTGFITADSIPTDFTGSVFSDDSTLLVDGVNGVIPYSVLSDAPTSLSDFSNDLDYAAIVATQIQTNGLPVDTTATGDLTVNGNITGPQGGNLTINTDNYLIIDSTNNGQIEIGRSSGLGDVLLGNTNNSTDVQVFGRLFIKGGGAPASSIGTSGDSEGIVAVDNNYVYYCTTSYDGITDIWKRVAWSIDTW